MQLVFLPATDPGDATYGAIPTFIEQYPDMGVHAVHFPRLVWDYQKGEGKSFNAKGDKKTPAVFRRGRHPIFA